MTDTTITLVGNLAEDPTLRFAQSGAAVCNFRVLSTPRTKVGDEWKDGETVALNCSIWREAAEHVAESLTKGMRVVVTGKLKSRSYETKEGDNRTVLEVDVDEVGPSLRYATAKVTKAASGKPAATLDAKGRLRESDPWATPALDDQPPF